MVLRMQNFNILGVQWKIQLSGGGGHEKPIERGGLPKKGGGGDTPMHTMNIFHTF